MELGAATHFAQGWNLKLLDGAKSIGVDGIRDGINWNSIETKKGVYDFSSWRLDYLRQTEKTGLDVTVVFNWGNALYDGGFTPYTEAGRQAFANFISATLDTFGGITAIEIGNEFNGDNFVSGPVLNGSYEERDDYYFKMIKTVYETVKADHPDVKILGGSTHSIPVGYLDKIFDQGGLKYLDGITIHPYTTDPEQLADQLAELRRAMGTQQRDIHITEFASTFEDWSDSARYLLKMTAVMAANDVESAEWYALAEQKSYPYMNLVDAAGNKTLTGTVFAFIQANLLPLGEARDISPDGTTYAYAFGARGLVLWGEGTSVTFNVPVTVYTFKGERITNFNGVLDPENPVIVLAESDLVAGKTVHFEGTSLVADSYHHFDVSRSADGRESFEGPWSYFALSGNGKLTELQTMAGGERENEPWTPYIGNAAIRPLMVTADAINPVDFGAKPGTKNQKSIVERFTASEDMTVRVEGHWDVTDQSRDGITLTVKLNGVIVHDAKITNAANGFVYDLVLKDLVMRAGDTLDFIVGTNRTADGTDLTERRIKIYEQEDGRIGGYADTVKGGAAADSLTGKTGATALLGFGGNDLLAGRGAGDFLDGGTGNDTLTGNGGADILIGGAGNDILTGGSERDVFSFGAEDGTDLVKDYRPGGDAPVQLTSGGGFTLLHSGADTILIYGETRVRFEGALLDEDDVTGAYHSSTEYAARLTTTGGGSSGVGSTTLGAIDYGSLQMGDDEGDSLRGDNGSSLMLGLGGDDILRGGGGDDHVAGGIGNDKLYGNDGNDILVGGDGNDALYGNRGRDAFRFDADDGRDIIYDYTRGDDAPIELTDGGRYSLARSGGNTILTYGNTVVEIRGALLDASDIAVFMV